MNKTNYKFELLPVRLKELHNIKSKAIIGCVAPAKASGFAELTDFVNSKGQMFLHKIPAIDVVKAEKKELPEWSLTNSKVYLLQSFRLCAKSFGMKVLYSK